MKLNGLGKGEDIIVIGGDEIMMRIYCMKFIFNNNSSEKESLEMWLSIEDRTHISQMQLSSSLIPSLLWGDMRYRQETLQKCN